MPMRLTWGPIGIVGAALLSLLAAGEAFGQNAGDELLLGTENRRRDQPILRIRSDVPTAPVRSLRFNVEKDPIRGDRLTLHSAGADKTVRRWVLDEKPNGQIELKPLEQVNWSLYHGSRGRIFAMDLLRDNQGARVAIGGNGLKTSWIRLTDPNETADAINLYDQGTSRRQVVKSIACDPNGQFLVAGENSADGTSPGNLMFWHVPRGAEPRVASVRTGLTDVDHVAVNPTGQLVIAAGPSTTANQYRIQLWDVSALQQQLRAPGQKLDSGLVVDVRPRLNIPLPCSEPKAIRNVVWTDTDNWQVATIVGIVKGTSNRATDLAGFAEVNNGRLWALQNGRRFIKRNEKQGLLLVNHGFVPVRYRFAQVDENGRRGQFSAEQVLAAGQSRRFPKDDLLAIEEIGQPPGSATTVNGEYDYEFWGYANTMDANRSGVAVIDAWRPGSGHQLLLLKNGRSGPELEEGRFDETWCVAVSPDGRFVAGVGQVQIQNPNVRDERCLVQQVRVWSTQTGKLLDSTPKFEEGAAPDAGGPIHDLAISRDASGRDEIFFSHNGDTSNPKFRKFVPLLRFNGIADVSPPPQRPTRLSKLKEFGVVVVTDRAPVMRGTQVLRRFPYGTLIRNQDLKEQKDGWLRIERGDLTNAWIQDKNIVGAGPTELSGFAVLSQRLEIKRGNNVLLTLRRGDFIRQSQFQGVVTFQGEQWARLNISGQEGFVLSRTLLPIARWFLADSSGQNYGPFDLTPGNVIQSAIHFTSNGNEYVAIGLADGIRIFDWSGLKNGTKPGVTALLRSFYGHDADVISLAASPDGSWLASGAVDGTIAAWRLKNLGRENELGLTVQGQGANTIVAAVAPNSAGEEAGLLKGDQVVSIEQGGRTIAAEDFRLCLEQPIPGVELLVKVRRRGANGRFEEKLLQTPVAYDSLYTLYPKHNRQWLLWTTAGVFDGTDDGDLSLKRSKDGGLPFEWHVNMEGANARIGLASATISMPGNDFLSKYWATQNLDDDLNFDLYDKLDAVIKNREPMTTDLPAPPQMLLAMESQNNRRVARFDVRTFDSQERIVERRLFLNGRLIKNSQEAAVLVDTLDPNLFRSGINTLIGTVVVKRGGKESHFRTVQEFLHRPASSNSPRLHFVGIGVSEVEGKPGLKLEFAGSDVTRIGEQLQKMSRRLDNGISSILATDGESQPTKPNILAALDQLASQVKPDDIAFIMLAGHGILNDSGKFVFQAGDGELVTQEELQAKLDRLHCRSVLLLDTCHAGGVAIDQQLQDFSKILIGPVILTSCRGKEESFSPDSVQGGIFTQALLEALGAEPLRTAGGVNIPQPRRLDADNNGVVTLQEIGLYVEQRTPQIAAAVQVSKPQNPEFHRSLTFRDRDDFVIALTR